MITEKFLSVIVHGLLNRCSYICSDLCGMWQQRWLFVKDTYMGYISPKDGLVKCVMLFDSGFEVSSSMYATGLSHGLQIATLSRYVSVLCCWWWSRYLLQVLREVYIWEEGMFLEMNVIKTCWEMSPSILNTPESTGILSEMLNSFHCGAIDGTFSIHFQLLYAFGVFWCMCSVRNSHSGQGMLILGIGWAQSFQNDPAVKKFLSILPWRYDM